MSDNYSIGRQRDCNIIAHATKQAIELSMHHYQARSLIINTKTGDILTYLFSDGYQCSAQDSFENSSVTQLEHNIFLEQEGDKILFILKTTHNCPSYQRYIDKMIEHNVSFEGEIISDIENEYPEYEKYRMGEIYVSFTLDLNNPETFKTSFYKINGSDIKQTALTTTKYDESTLPDIEKETQLYFQYVNIGKLISWADERLPEELKKSEVDVINMDHISKHLSDALIKSMEKEFPFSAEHLFTGKYSEHIINTLSFIKSEGFNPVVVASLCGKALIQAARRVNNSEIEESDFFDILTISKNIYNFSIKHIDEQTDQKVKENCEIQMVDEKARLLRCIAMKSKYYEPNAIEEKTQKLLSSF